MDYTLALLFSLLHILSVATAAPLPLEAVKMKSKVKWMAEQLVVRLEILPVPPGLTPSPQVDDLEGLSSIVTVLDGYNSLISDKLSGVSQVKAEISSLTGYLHQWRQGHCALHQPKLSLSGPLQELQSQKQFIHTVGLEALMRTKEVLNVLLKNLDHLETC